MTTSCPSEMGKRLGPEMAIKGGGRTPARCSYMDHPRRIGLVVLIVMSDRVTNDQP